MEQVFTELSFQSPLLSWSRRLYDNPVMPVYTGMCVSVCEYTNTYMCILFFSRWANNFCVGIYHYGCMSFLWLPKQSTTNLSSHSSGGGKSEIKVWARLALYRGSEAEWVPWITSTSGGDWTSLTSLGLWLPPSNLCSHLHITFPSMPVSQIFLSFLSKAYQSLYSWFTLDPE